MAIFRWGANFDPFAGLRQIQRDLEQMTWPWVSQSRRVGGGSYPPVNVYESAGEIVVQCELPGVEPAELDVTITGETLTIKGQKAPLNGDKEVRYIRSERGSGQFTRTIVLPDVVEAEKIQADMRDGIMTIRLPKAAAAQPRQVEIKTAK